jgi:thymidylate synthase
MNKWSNYGKWRHPKERNKYMNTLDKQYQDLLQDILDNGVAKQDRTGTGTISVFGRQIRHKMSDGFPLLTTKKMPFKTIVTELLWFLRGDTNIKYLVDNNCHIWDGDAYKNYLGKKMFSSSFEALVESDQDVLLTQEEFIEKIKTDLNFASGNGELGPIYGKQWRSWEGYKHGMVLGAGLSKEQPIDQIQNLINDLKTNPDSRRLMVSAWAVHDLPNMVLPPCHYGFQVYTRELSFDERLKLSGIETDNQMSFIDYVSILDGHNISTRAISLMWNQRSVDTFLGLPFNIASYGLLLEIIAKEVNMVPDELIGNLGDVHLYSNHIEQAREQIGREPFELPKLGMDYREGEYNKNLTDFVPDDFYLINYQSHPTIKAPLSN